jgi:hypothetical protein
MALRPKKDSPKEKGTIFKFPVLTIKGIYFALNYGYTDVRGYFNKSARVDLELAVGERFDVHKGEEAGTFLLHKTEDGKSVSFCPGHTLLISNIALAKYLGRGSKAAFKIERLEGEEYEDGEWFKCTKIKEEESDPTDNADKT